MVRKTFTRTLCIWIVPEAGPTSEFRDVWSGCMEAKSEGAQVNVILTSNLVPQGSKSLLEFHHAQFYIQGFLEDQTINYIANTLD